MELNDIGTIVVQSATHIHKGLGPGLLESVYETVLAKTLAENGLHVQRQVPISIEFEGILFDEGFRADIVVERSVILELKSVEAVSLAHKKQLLTYLKLSNMHLGYILNFSEVLMKNGISRIINSPAYT